MPTLKNLPTSAISEKGDISCGPAHVRRDCLSGNGLPIETLSKMLGHTNLRVTQVYARITYRKVTEDMKILKTN